MAMTLSRTPIIFAASLPLIGSGAYILFLTNAGIVIGFAEVYDNELRIGWTVEKVVFVGNQLGSIAGSIGWFAFLQ